MRRTTILFALALAITAPASAAAPPLYKNCTAMKKKYPHGVGKLHARDETSGKSVTTFKRSDRL